MIIVVLDKETRAVRIASDSHAIILHVANVAVMITIGTDEANHGSTWMIR